ncbi:hypothetical protein [Candidatus Phytoplasma australiense]|uniref:Uncharacterized protein n=1 Tax=Strawberry lethal yellows phytoplasma (CPA) str. NZSb11 TaxID=980422 RepID=R4RX50_PHYAS|nr:hypothetical protein [Candidatus Phytoplasma australiense]AGL90442.1 Hypothetical Protein SLY_0523 [Strawberry lethal yellows phytoplasma (CPA) str. NZSb11]
MNYLKNNLKFFLKIFLGTFLYAFAIYFFIFTSFIKKGGENGFIFSGGTEGITVFLGQIIPFLDNNPNLKLILILSVFLFLCLLIAAFFLDFNTIKKSLGTTLLLILFLLVFNYFFQGETQRKVFSVFLQRREAGEKGFHLTSCGLGHLLYVIPFSMGFVFFVFGLYFLMPSENVFFRFRSFWANIG